MVVNALEDDLFDPLYNELLKNFPMSLNCFSRAQRSNCMERSVKILDRSVLRA